MKRAIFGAMGLAVAISFTACDQENAPSSQIDPKLDGLSGQTVAIDSTVLDNHAEMARKAQPAPAPVETPAATPAPAEATPAPASSDGAPPIDVPSSTSSETAPPPSDE